MEIPVTTVRVATIFWRPDCWLSGLGRQCLAVATMLLLLSAQSAWASDLSKITGIDINIPAGTISFSTPQPQAIPDMLKNLPTDVLELLNPYGLKLAFMIREARAQALNSAQPMPPNIRALLVPFFPAYILDKARWTVYDANRITLDSLILGTDCSDLNLPFNFDCKMGAITLDNVVVFRGAAQAEQNYVSWAHELVHVSQYDSMGIDGFAYVYASPGAYSLEKQAYDWQAAVQNAVQGRGVLQTYYTLAPGPRPPLQPNAFSAAATRLLSEPAWAQAHRLNTSNANTTLDCVAFRDPAADTGISLQASTDHLNNGGALEAQGNLRGAIAEYRQAVQANHTNALAYDRLGTLLVRTGQHAEGIQNLQKAVCYDESQASYRQHLSSATSSGGGTVHLLLQSQFNVFHNPADYSYHLQLAAALRQKGDADDAVAQEWAAEQMRPPDGGPLYATLRNRLMNDWAADFEQTNPISNVRSRTRVTLRRLDSCVLSWNTLTEALNTPTQGMKSFTETVDLRRIRPHDIFVTGGNQINFSNTSSRDAITESLVVQINYLYNPVLRTRPMFAWMQAPSFPEANALVPLLRDLVNSCSSVSSLDSGKK
jgi:tetratricopeptide (TPR) repeat protein